MRQRKWMVDEKLAIVMEGLKEKRSVADICREHRMRMHSYEQVARQVFRGWQERAGQWCFRRECLQSRDREAPEDHQ